MSLATRLTMLVPASTSTWASEFHLLRPLSGIVANNRGAVSTNPRRECSLPGWLGNRLRIANLPALVVPGLGRAIDTPEHVPAFSGSGLDPVGFLAFGRLVAEVDVVGTIGILHEALLVAVDARELLIGLQLGAGLVVVEGE